MNVMKNIISVPLLLLCAGTALAQEPPPQLACIEQSVINQVVRIMFEQTSKIDQQRAEIEALKRTLSDRGIEYVPAWQRFIQQIQEAHRGK